MKKISIWPKSKFKIKKFLRFDFPPPTSCKVERRLEKMFPSGFAVLCSSGRAAINIALVFKKHSRPDFVGVNHYTSHCVLDSISRVATPIVWNVKPKSNAKTRLIYHQWGYVQKHLPKVSTIDDCVDSLCEIGTELFPTSNDFEIWSLPKILGTTSGAVLWCKKESVAKEIRLIRDSRGGGLFLWILRNLGYFNKNIYWLWQGLESQKGKLSKPEIKEINFEIDHWKQKIYDRKKKLNLIWEFAPKWLKKTKGRLPTVIPLQYDLYKSNPFLKKLKIEFKHFEKFQSPNKSNLVKVFPIPIHEDISFEFIYKLKKIL